MRAKQEERYRIRKNNQKDREAFTQFISTIIEATYCIYNAMPILRLGSPVLIHIEVWYCFVPIVSGI